MAKISLTIVANFLSRHLGSELRELCQVDGVDECVEDRVLDVIILLGARTLDRLTLRVGGRLAHADRSGLGLLFTDWRAAARRRCEAAGLDVGGATGCVANDASDLLRLPNMVLRARLR